MRRATYVLAAAIGLTGCGGGGGGGGGGEPAEDVALLHLEDPITNVGDVALVDNTGSNLRSIAGTHANAIFTFVQAQWNPARTRVAFVADLDVNGVSELYVVDP